VLAESAADWRRRGSPKDDGYGLFFASSIARIGANAQVWLRCFNRDAKCVFIDATAAKDAASRDENRHLRLYSFPDVYRSVVPFCDTSVCTGSFQEMQQSMRDSLLSVETVKPSSIFSWTEPRRKKRPIATTQQNPNSVQTINDVKNVKNVKKRRLERKCAANTLESVPDADGAIADLKKRIIIEEPRGRQSIQSVLERPAASVDAPAKRTVEKDLVASTSSLLSASSTIADPPFWQRWRDNWSIDSAVDSDVTHGQKQGIDDDCQEDTDEQWLFWKQKYAELQAHRLAREQYRLRVEEERSRRRQQQLEQLAAERRKEEQRQQLLEHERQLEAQRIADQEIAILRRLARESRENLPPGVDLLGQSVAMMELERVFSAQQDLSLFLSSESDSFSAQKLSSCPIVNPWTYQNNSCCIDVVLMLALAAGGNANTLRAELLFEDERYDRLPDLAAKERRLLLRRELQIEDDAIRCKTLLHSCSRVRDRLADCCSDKRDIIVGGDFQDAHEILDILLTALVGHRHVVCEETWRLPSANSTISDEQPLPFQMQTIGVFPVFHARVLQQCEEKDQIDCILLKAYKGEHAGRQSLQFLVNRDNDFSPLTRIGDSSVPTHVRRALLQKFDSNRRSKPIDYVFVYLNRRRERNVIYAPVVFERVLALPSLTEEHFLSSTKPRLGSAVTCTESFVLAGVACFHKAHWTLAFRSDSPAPSEKFTDLGADDFDGPAAARWLYYDDLQSQQTGNNSLRPIGNTYHDLLSWGPDKRSAEFVQKTGSLFLYIKPTVDTR